MQFDVYEYSNKGGRSYNEDASGCIYEDDDGRGVFVVADGLGGHLRGELASETAVDMLVLENWIDKNADNSVLLKQKISDANQSILELQVQEKAVLKTTVAAVAVCDDIAVWANVGDSRVYFIHENKLHAFTEDHSVAYKKFKAGLITREQLKTDEDQSQLLRALGNEERNEPSIYKADVKLKRGDAFLLCSDGAWELLSDEEIVIDFLKAENSRMWCELLLVRMMERIGPHHDNITLVAVILE